MDTATNRRHRMHVRGFRSLEEHDRADAAYWTTLPPEDRTLLAWKLSEAQCGWRVSRLNTDKTSALSEADDLERFGSGRQPMLLPDVNRRPRHLADLTWSGRVRQAWRSRHI